MKRRVKWSAAAADDYHDQLHYIAEQNPRNADLVDKRLLATIEKLADMPMGRAGRVEGTYEKLVNGTFLIIAYHITEDTLNIVRIIHAKRDWPEGEWPE